MKTLKYILSVLSILAVILTFGAVRYLDKKVVEIDEAVFQHLMDDHNSKVKHEEDN